MRHFVVDVPAKLRSSLLSLLSGAGRPARLTSVRRNSTRRGVEHRQRARTAAKAFPLLPKVLPNWPTRTVIRWTRPTREPATAGL